MLSCRTQTKQHFGLTYPLLGTLLQPFDVSHVPHQLGVREPGTQGVRLDTLHLLQVGLGSGHTSRERNCAPFGHRVPGLLNGAEPGHDARQRRDVDDPAAVTTLHSIET